MPTLQAIVDAGEALATQGRYAEALHKHLTEQYSGAPGIPPT